LFSCRSRDILIFWRDCNDWTIKNWENWDGMVWT
jgi:hypothetical protein